MRCAEVNLDVNVMILFFKFSTQCQNSRKRYTGEQSFAAGGSIEF